MAVRVAIESLIHVERGVEVRVGGGSKGRVARALEDFREGVEAFVEQLSAFAIDPEAAGWQRGEQRSHRGPRPAAGGDHAVEHERALAESIQLGRGLELEPVAAQPVGAECVEDQQDDVRGIRLRTATRDDSQQGAESQRVACRAPEAMQPTRAHASSLA